MRRLVLVCAVAALAISPAFGQSRRGGSNSNDRDSSGISGFDVPNFNRTGGNAAPRAPIPPRVPPVSPSGVTSAASSAGRGGARAVAAVVAGGAVAAGAAGAAASRRRQSNP